MHRLEKALSGPARVNVFPELATRRAKGVRARQRSAHQGAKQLTKMAIRPVVAARPAATEKAALDQLERSVRRWMSGWRTLPTNEKQIRERQQKARWAFNEVDKRPRS